MMKSTTFLYAGSIVDGIGKRSYPNGHSRENHDGTHAAKVFMAEFLMNQFEMHGTPAAKQALSNTSEQRKLAYFVPCLCLVWVE